MTKMMVTAELEGMRGTYLSKRKESNEKQKTKTTNESKRKKKRRTNY
ncbi:MAG: hypothetical protein ACI8RD_002981 [Bacillariaceae sp.]|jgi:hypothetical protein